MAHSPEKKGASPRLLRPLYTNRPCLDMLARFSMWRTCSGLLTARRASMPPKPLFLEANRVLCQVEKLSSCGQPCQLVVKGHLWPLALSLAAVATSSGQVEGALSGSSPAALNASL